MNTVTIMGILNITPDSFSDGGMYFNSVEDAVTRARQLIAEGADSIDIGGESTRPGSEFITAEDEIRRIIPVISAIRSEIDTNIPISVDTYKASVAEAALEHGATMVNSLGGFELDRKLAKVVAKYKCPICIYHIKGTPKTMQTGEITYTDIISDINEFFEKHIAIGSENGIKREQFILDPGIGFGKTVEQNIELIQRLDEFAPLSLPVLIGVSRKSHLATILKEKLSLSESPGTNERLEAALAETAIAIQNGATIIRTHDVLVTKKFVKVLETFL